MLSVLALFGQMHVSFMGLHGLIGFLVGLIVFIVVGVILWKILAIVLPKLGLGADWVTVIMLLVGLILFLFFLQVVGIWVWAS